MKASRYVTPKTKNHQRLARASSFRRIAQDHRSYARSHNFLARQKDISPNDKLLHRALAILHRETAEIFSGESKRLRAMR